MPSSSSSSSRDEDRRERHIRKKISRLRFSAEDFVTLSPDSLRKHYSIGKTLHRGGRKSSRSSQEPAIHTTESAMSPRAHVHACKHRDTGQTRAVKVVNRSSRWDHWRNEQTEREFKVLQELDHPNIIRVYQFFEGKDHYYLVMDVCKGGDLLQEMDAWGCLEEQDVAFLVKTVLQALSYCHKNGITHGNVKPEHILLDKDKDWQHAKLTDFSCASTHESRKQSRRHKKESGRKSKQDDESDEEDKDDRYRERLGTFHYWAPEVIKRGSESPKRDVWACGVLCYLLLSRQMPFSGTTQDEVCQKIKKGEFSFDDYDNPQQQAQSDEDSGQEKLFSWSNVSSNAKSFIARLLTYDDRDRPSARQALDHRWLAEMTSLDRSKRTTSESATTMHTLLNLNHFNTESKLQQAALTFIGAQMMLKEERKAIDNLFNSMDLKHDGRLSPREVQKGYKNYFHIELSDDEVKDLFDRVDLDRSGYIEYSEFLIASMNQKQLLEGKKLQQAFALFDKDKSGTISKANLKKFLKAFQNDSTSRSSRRLSKDNQDEVIDRLLQTADEDGDGEISFEEFMAMMLRSTNEPDETNNDASVVPEKSQPSQDEEEEEEEEPLSRQGSGLELSCTGESIQNLQFTKKEFVAKSPKEFNELYTISDFINKGAFGSVYICTHNELKSVRALKVMDKSGWREGDNAKFTHEYLLLKELDHPNLLPFYHMFEDKFSIYMVMAILNGHDVAYELDKGGRMNESQASTLIFHLLSCLNYCHQKKIVHRDLTAKSILLEDPRDFRKIKLIHFCTARKFEEGEEMTERVGTTEFMAPEVVQMSYFGGTADVWSVGVLCYLLLSNEFPFGGKFFWELYEKIKIGTYSFPKETWWSVSDDAKDFIEMLLRVEPERRPSADRAMAHKWLTNARRNRAAILEEHAAGQKLSGASLDKLTHSALQNMQAFKGSKAQDAIKRFVATQLLLSEEKAAIDLVFKNVDITCDGKLTKSEVAGAYVRLVGHSLSDEELEDFFDRVDADKSGFVDYDEFVLASMNEKLLFGRDKLKDAFDAFDTDGSGVISVFDIQKALLLYGGDENGQGNHEDFIEFQNMFQKADTDGDGKISFDEFVTMLTKKYISLKLF